MKRAPEEAKRAHEGMIAGIDGEPANHILWGGLKKPITWCGRWSTVTALRREGAVPTCVPCIVHEARARAADIRIAAQKRTKKPRKKKR